VPHGISAETIGTLGGDIARLPALGAMARQQYHAEGRPVRSGIDAAVRIAEVGGLLIGLVVCWALIPQWLRRVAAGRPDGEDSPG
jgi:hypothetical protein